MVYISFLFTLAIEVMDLVQSSDANLQNILSIELLTLLVVAVLAAVGIEKVRTNLTHGKKFKASLLYFGAAFVILLLLIVYTKFLKNAGFVF